MKVLTASLFGKKTRARTISVTLVVAAYILVQILQSTGSLTRLIISLLVPVCAYLTAAIGLNLNVGISGELNLGQAGFMSIGGFTAAVVSGLLTSSVPSAPLRLFIAMLLGAALAGLVGWLISIPVLKLEGDYLAIVTLAFGQIIMSLINNLYVGFDADGLHFSFIDNNVALGEGGKMLISGPMGATGIKTISSFGAGIILVIVSLLIVYNLMYSKTGRAIMACRDNRIAAQTIGIRVSGAKTVAFVISSALAGAAGALYILNYSSVAAIKFDFNMSILILVYVVLGGLGNMTGTIIATTLLVMLPELLRSLQGYRMLIYAIILILIMILTNNIRIRTFLTRLKRASADSINHSEGGSDHV